MPRVPAIICPCPSCHHTRPGGQIMCRSHWRRVSANTRLALHTAWNIYRAVKAKGENTDEVWAAYREVRERAIQEAA